MLDKLPLAVSILANQREGGSESTTSLQRKLISKLAQRIGLTFLRWFISLEPRPPLQFWIISWFWISYPKVFSAQNCDLEVPRGVQIIHPTILTSCDPESDTLNPLQPKKLQCGDTRGVPGRSSTTSRGWATRTRRISMGAQNLSNRWLKMRMTLTSRQILRWEFLEY